MTCQAGGREGGEAEEDSAVTCGGQVENRTGHDGGENSKPRTMGNVNVLVTVEAQNTRTILGSPTDFLHTHFSSSLG